MVAASIDNTLGAVFIGNLCVVCLYGLTTLQTYTYYSRSKNDAMLLKLAIAALWALDTLHAILTSHTVYFYSITHFGDAVALTKITWSAVAYILVTAISDSIVRAVFCYRIWILSSSKILFGVNVFLSALLLADEIALVTNLFHIPTFAGLQKINWLFLMGLASGVVADIFIAGTMTMLLVKSRGHYHRTRSTVNTLILYIVSTGALTSICMAGSLIAFAAAQGTFLFIAFFFPLSKLLLNSLLAMLNARQALRQQMDHVTTHGGATLPLSFAHTTTGMETNIESSMQFSQEAQKEGGMSIGPTFAY